MIKKKNLKLLICTWTKSSQPVRNGYYQALGNCNIFKQPLIEKLKILYLNVDKQLIEVGCSAGCILKF